MMFAVSNAAFRGPVRQPAPQSQVKFAAQAKPAKPVDEDDEDDDEPYDPKAGEPQLSKWFLNRHYESVFIQAVPGFLQNNHNKIGEWVKGLFEQHGDEAGQKIINRLQPEVDKPTRDLMNRERDDYLAKKTTAAKLDLSA